MTADGFIVGGYDGPTPQGGVWNTLPPPFQIEGVRPDAWGISPTTGQVAVGEAKTPEDINTSHTLTQLRVFAQLLQRDSGVLSRLYVAVPRSSVLQLDRVLASVGLMHARHLVRLHIPDSFVFEDRDARP